MLARCVRSEGESVSCLYRLQGKYKELIEARHVYMYAD